MNSSSQMLDRTTLKAVENYFDNKAEHESKITLKNIAFEMKIYVTRKHLRGGLYYVR